MLSWALGGSLIIITFALYLYFTEKYPVDATSLLVMTLFIATGILTPQEGLAGFTNSATVTVAAMFVLSAAVFKTGLLSRVSALLIWVSRFHYVLLLGVTMLIAGLLSAFINDTAVVALLMPTVIQVAAQTGTPASRLLMPLSFGALLGGVCTLLGTSTNILVSGIAEKAGLAPLGMFEFTPAGLVFLSVGIAYMLIVGTWLLPKRESGDSLNDLYALNDYATDVEVLKNSPYAGQQMKDTELARQGLEVNQVIRAGHSIPAMSYLRLQAGDILKVIGGKNQIQNVQEQDGLQLRSDRKLSEAEQSMDGMKLFELVISRSSHWIGKTLAEMDFRNAHSGATVMAIRRRKGIRHEKLSGIRLRSGDVLLVRGLDEQVQKMKQHEHVVVVSDTSLPAKMPWQHTALILTVLLGIILVSALKLTSIVVASLVGCLILVVSGRLSTEEAYEAINWPVIFMLAGVLSMGTALEKTGGTTLIAQGIQQFMGGFDPALVLSGFFLLTFMGTNIMSNNATAALMAPIAIETAQKLSLNPRPFLMAVTFAASLSFMTPMSYQTNAMIYQPGGYRFTDYLKIGTPLNLLLWLLASLMLPKFFPF